MGRGQTQKKAGELVAVAIDNDKGSQHALKWTIDSLVTRGQALTLLHVRQRTAIPMQTQRATQYLTLPHRSATPTPLKCNEVIIEDKNIAKALVNYVVNNSIDILVLGAPSRSGLLRYRSRHRFKTTDVPNTVSKEAPSFCTVYVIGKGKISYMRAATTSLSQKAYLPNQKQHQTNKASDTNDTQFSHNQQPRGWPDSVFSFFKVESSDYVLASVISHLTSGFFVITQSSFFYQYSMGEDAVSTTKPCRSPFTRGGASANKSYELSSDTDISFVSSGRPSVDHMFPSFYDDLDLGPRLSISPEIDSRSSTSSYSSGMNNRSSTSSYSGHKFIDMSSSPYDFSSSSIESGSSCSQLNFDEMEAEMRRLRLELKQTMDMYSTACKEALTAKQKATELHRWKLEEEQRLEQVRLAEEAALALAENEKLKCMAAMEAAEAAQRIAVMEAQKRRNAEMKAFKEAEEKKAIEAKTYDFMFRKYTIEEIEAATNNFSSVHKIGEGGYGPVYRGELDHTPVAIKVLRPDAAQGQSQFQQEVPVLCCIRHPNMVLLLGACAEYGCLVYEYMANGSLEDRLLQRGNTPVIPWQLRFQIAAEIGTGLLFLHQTKPEPIVHRDLKPANILLDHNYVSKISDVGLARLVPPSVADSVTQYHMTSTAGTLCYIDPEYQQTGMLGVKSDIYSLGIMFLQLVTAKPPMGLTHHVQRAIEKGTFAEMLDPAVPDWPVEEALKFAKLALQCAELRRKDRPDLGKVVLPELNRLRALANDRTNSVFLGGGGECSPRQSSTPTIQDVISDGNLSQPGYESSRSRSSTSSYPERKTFLD
ncbi:U-box domain-containing protein 35-like [Pyrus communis]|uniref:U-box domain-containing protein 35-like n=1 Tax=Pyrus communis TaxID=23211 RepID=UPI0035C0A961